MQPRIQQSAAFLLAVFAVGALLLPVAHDFTHVRSLEHRHGRAAADFSLIAVGPGGIDALDFFVEERTIPHDPTCELCARLALDSPWVVDPVVPLVHVDEKTLPDDAVLPERAGTSRQIRAPPIVS